MNQKKTDTPGGGLSYKHVDNRGTVAARDGLKPTTNERGALVVPFSRSRRHKKRFKANFGAAGLAGRKVGSTKSHLTNFFPLAAPGVINGSDLAAAHDNVHNSEKIVRDTCVLVHKAERTVFNKERLVAAMSRKVRPAHPRSGACPTPGKGQRQVWGRPIGRAKRKTIAEKAALLVFQQARLWAVEGSRHNNKKKMKAFTTIAQTFCRVWQSKINERDKTPRCNQ